MSTERKTAIKEKAKRFASVFLKTGFLLLALFLLYTPALYQYKQIYLCLMVATIICFQYFMMVFKEKKIDHLVPIMLLFIVMLIISTLINGTALDEALWAEGFFCISLAMLFAIGLRYDSCYFLLVFYFYCVMIVVWNLFSFPLPFWQYGEEELMDAHVYTILRNSNIGIVYCFPALFAGYVLFHKDFFSKPIKIAGFILYWLFYGFFIFLCVYFHSKNNLVILILWGIFSLAGEKIHFEKVFSPFAALILDIPIFAGTQLYDPKSKGLITTLIQLLKETASFDARVSVWKEARASIAKHPIIGIGTSYSLKDIVFSEAFHSHNLILNVLVKLGAIGIAIFTWALIEFCLLIRKIADRKIKWGAILFFACCLLLFEFDTYDTHFIYGMAAFLYFICLSNCTSKTKERFYWHFKKEDIALMKKERELEKEEAAFNARKKKYIGKANRLIRRLTK